MQIREERHQDRLRVREGHARAFGDHGDMVAGLLDPLRAIPGCLSLVAVEDDQVIGNVMFTRSLLDAPRELIGVQVLSPLGILPEFQGRGAGRALVEHGVEVLDRRGEPLVFLEGDPAYYSRLGFTAGGDSGFRKPSLRIPDAGFHVRKLSAYEPEMTGTLVYASVFWEHDAVGLR